MIQWYELDIRYVEGDKAIGEIIFAHVDHKTGIFRHFAIERIVKMISGMTVPPPVIEFAIDPIFARHCVTDRGVEPHRLERITPLDLAHYPVVMAHFPGIGNDMDEHLLIDGHHRYVKAAMLGWKTLRAYTLPQEMWEPFLVNIPEEMLVNKAEDYKNQHIKPLDSRIK